VDPLPTRAGRQTVPLVRGIIGERVVISSRLDPLLDLRALARYASLSVRKLRDCIADPSRPIPHYRVGGKLLVRVSDFDAWLSRYRHDRPDVDRIVADVLRDLT
jgi:hypothetical protein